MTRRPLIVSILVLALAAFVGAAWYVTRPAPVTTAAPLPLAQNDALLRGSAPILGPRDAPVTIVEFFDPACEACRAFYPVVKDIMAEHGDAVRVVIRYAAFHGEASVQAIRLLEAAGWGDSDEDGVLDKLNSEGKMVRLHLRFYVYEEPENDVRMEAANLIADMLSEVGIDTTIEAMTLPNLTERLKAGSYDLALVSYAMDAVPDPGFMLMRGNTGNYTRYRNDIMTGLCEDLRTQTSQSGYQQVLWRIQSQFAEDCPFLCLYWRMGKILTRYMFTTARDIREYELLRGIESFHP